MKKVLLTLCLTLGLGAAALAQTPAAPAAPAASCEAKAVGKDGRPLAGAAKNSFMKKCEGAPAAGNAADCEARAVSKKDGKPLAGAAKAASIKKCMGPAAK